MPGLFLLLDRKKGQKVGRFNDSVIFDNSLQSLLNQNQIIT